MTQSRLLTVGFHMGIRVFAVVFCYLLISLAWTSVDSQESEPGLMLKEKDFLRLEGVIASWKADPEIRRVDKGVSLGTARRLHWFDDHSESSYVDILREIKEAGMHSVDFLGTAEPGGLLKSAAFVMRRSSTSSSGIRLFFLGHGEQIDAFVPDGVFCLKLERTAWFMCEYPRVK